jgi:enoyl-CoA hydratase/carnithine racemase
MASSLVIHQDSGVAYFGLNHPPVNTLTIAMLDEVRNAFERGGFQCAVFRSEIPGMFSHGLDPKALIDADVAGRLEVFRRLGLMIRAVMTAGIPTIAVVDGAAFAGGAVLSLLGDTVFINESSGRIAFSEVKVGLPLPLFIQSLIRLRCRASDFFDVAVMGRNVDAAYACETGIAKSAYKNAQDINMPSLLEKITRLNPAVLAQTLKEGRKNLVLELDAFLKDPGDFVTFLSDRYIAAGLKQALGGRPQ